MAPSLTNSLALPGAHFLFLLLLLSAGPAFPADLTGRVVGIADGDTLTILDDRNQQHKIRLAGIDAPEKRQPYGERSRQNLAAIAFKKPVVVEWDKLDRYGRLIGKVRVQPPECLACGLTLDAGLAQVRQGLAWHYKRYEREQSRDDRTLYANGEVEARQKGLGLWADSDAVPPWDWRRRRARPE